MNFSTTVRLPLAQIACDRLAAPNNLNAIVAALVSAPTVDKPAVAPVVQKSSYDHFATVTEVRQPPARGIEHRVFQVTEKVSSGAALVFYISLWRIESGKLCMCVNVAPDKVNSSDVLVFANRFLLALGNTIAAQNVSPWPRILHTATN